MLDYKDKDKKYSMGGRNLGLFIESQKMSVREFEGHIGVNINRLQKSIERDSNLKLDILNKIVGKYPSVNTNWLITGEGEMFKKEGDQPPTPDQKYTGDGLSLYAAFRGWKQPDILKALDISNGTLYIYYRSEKLTHEVKEKAATALGKTIEEIFSLPQDRNKRRIPMIGEGAAGGNVEINVHDDTAFVGEYIDVGDLLRDSEAAFTVYGNSMTPAYPPGCILGIKRNFDTFIQPGETYLLLTKSNRVFKRLFYNKEKTAFTCYSDNTMKYETGPLSGQWAYPPFEVPLEEVISVFDITGMIKRNRNSGIINRQL